MYEKETEKKHITVIFTGTEEELQVEIRNFVDQLQIKEKTSQRIQKELEKLTALELHTENKASEVQKEVCKLEADMEHEQNTKEKRNSQLSKLAETFELSGLTANGTEEDVDLLHDQVKRKFQGFVNSIKSLKLEQEKEQTDLHDEIYKCLKLETKIESEIREKEKTISSNDTEIQKLSDKLRSVNEKLLKKQQIDRELEECRNKRVKAGKDEDPEALSTKIDELQQSCSSLEIRQNQLSTELKELLRFQGTQEKLQTQEENQKNALLKIQRLRSQNEGAISKLLGNSTDNTIKEDFDSLLQKLVGFLSFSFF